MRYGIFVERLNRFVARVELEDGSQRLVHVASSGRMSELLVKGAPVVIYGDGKPGQKTEGRLGLVQHGGFWVSVDTGVPGRVLRAALEARQIPAFAEYPDVRPEVAFGESRIDFQLTGAGLPPCLLEVKSVTSVVVDADGTPVGRFPDAPTERGLRHLHELAAAVKQGYRTAVFFIVQRGDAQAFGPWDEIDPAFGQGLRAAAQHGVEVHAWRLRVNPTEIALEAPLPVRL